MDKIFSPIKGRIVQFIENKGIAKEKFFEKTGITSSNFKGKGAESELGGDKIVKILSEFPCLNADWLLLGVGEMIKEDQDEDRREIITVGKHVHSRLHKEDYDLAFQDWKGLAMYNTPISASFIEHYKDITVYEPEYYLRDPRFRDCDFGARITGDSMHSEIRHGDSVVCKEVLDKSFLVFGEIYYIVATNGLETCKYVNAGKDEDHILLVPRNEKISSTPIKKSMIQNIYKVRGILRGY